jgi:chorismate synthase
LVQIRSHVIQPWRRSRKASGIDVRTDRRDPEDALNCADPAQQQMMELIDQSKAAGDTLGGIFEAVARGVNA